MWRILLAGLVLSCRLVALADEPPVDPKKPMYERLLKGADARRAQELEGKIAKLQAANQPAEAIKLAEELLDLRTRRQGVDHWQVRDARNLLSRLRSPLTDKQFEQVMAARKLAADVVALYAKGQYREAIGPAESAIRIRREVLGNRHHDTAASLNNLASLHEVLAAYALCEPLYLEALDICREVKGESHPSTATSLSNLANVYSLTGAYDKAEPIYQDALRMRREVLGTQHQDTAASLNNLAYMYRVQGAYSKAENLQQEALRIIQNMRGKNHPETAVIMGNLGLLYEAQGAHTKAEHLHQDALRIFLGRLGKAHPDTNTAFNNLATSYFAQGAYVKAEPLFQNVLQFRLAVLGDKHPLTALSLSNLAFLYKSQGKYEKAEPLLQAALRVYSAGMGETHPEIATILSNLASLHASQGEFEQAEALHQRALRIRRAGLPENHPDIAASVINLATLYSLQGEYTKAEPLFLEGLQIFRAAWGEKHRETASSLGGLATVYYLQGAIAKAEAHYREALLINREVLGENHPNTANILALLASLHVAEGKYEKALPACAEAARAFETSRLGAASGLARSLAAGESSPYLLQASSLAALARPGEAYKALELELARGLFDEQASRRELGLSPDERKQRAAISERLEIIGRRVLKLVTQKERSETEQRELSAFIAERARQYDELAQLAAVLSQREIADAAAIQAALPGECALITWVDEHDKSGNLSEHWGCVLLATGEPKWEKLPGTGENGKWTMRDIELPSQLRQALASATAPAAEIAGLAEKLNRQRLAPLAKHLAGVKRICVVPVHAMAGVPLEVLSRDYTISYVPSGTFLARLKEKAPAAGEALLAVGDPVLTRAGAKANGTQIVPAALPPGGLRIIQVAPDGAAAKAGLRPGDVIVKYGDEEITSLVALDEAIAKNAGTKEVAISIWREGEEKLLARTMAPGKLGVAVDKEPAREAIAGRRKLDATLSSLRGGDWKEIPGTRLELTHIAGLFGDRASALFDSSASETSLEELRKKGDLAKFRYVHFATHGETNNVAAMESALILAQDKLPQDTLPKVGEPYNNGQLSASEVLEYWKLDAELVTLSACETALGRDGGGDGLLGFAQAFLTAGARSVCLSLWKVDDTATTLLMQRFYQNLLGKRAGLDKPIPKAEALAEAKSWLREISSEDALKLTASMASGVVRRGKGEVLKPIISALDSRESPTKDAKPFSHPRYWSAFILIGDSN